MALLPSPRGIVQGSILMMEADVQYKRTLDTVSRLVFQDTIAPYLTPITDSYAVNPDTGVSVFWKLSTDADYTTVPEADFTVDFTAPTLTVEIKDPPMLTFVNPTDIIDVRVIFYVKVTDINDSILNEEQEVSNQGIFIAYDNDNEVGRSDAIEASQSVGAYSMNILGTPVRLEDKVEDIPFNATFIMSTLTSATNDDLQYTIYILPNENFELNTLDPANPTEAEILLTTFDGATPVEKTVRLLTAPEKGYPAGTLEIQFSHDSSISANGARFVVPYKTTADVVDAENPELILGEGNLSDITTAAAPVILTRAIPYNVEVTFEVTESLFQNGSKSIFV